MKNHVTGTNRTSTSATGRRHIRGQGLTEYIIIVALIAIASIVAVSYFGSAVQASFLSLGTDLTGGAAVDRVTTTDPGFKAAESKAKAQTTLKDYNK
jgi:Flp pilus assembly pilin Flp